MLPAMSDNRIESDQTTARYDLIQRIEVFVQKLEKSRREPTSWECEHALRALRALEESDFARGEQVIMWAEWPAMRHPSPVVVAKLQPQYIRTNTAGLRARLEQVVQKIV